MAESFTVADNRLSPLTTGAERLDALVALIEGARESLRLLYYIYGDDPAGRRINAALLAALARGVRVWLIVDGFGSDAPDAFFRPLQDRGAEVCRFLPRYGRRYLLRNHQKLALADGRTALVGGFNVEQDYFADGPEAWRDLGLLLEGPAVTHITGYFDALNDWIGTERSRLRDLRRLVRHWSQTEGDVRWVLGGPTTRLSPWARAMRRDIGTGPREVAMIAAYFAPSFRVLRAIGRVARRGTQVRVITAARSDNRTTIAAARHTYALLLRRGVRIYEYQRSKLHTKLYLVDDAVHLGSANFDVRSLFLNLEIMLRVENAAFAAAMRRYFEGEVEQSHAIDRREHARAGWLQRLRWALAYALVATVDGGLTRRLNFGPSGQ